MKEGGTELGSAAVSGADTRREEEGAADAWGRAVSDTRGGEGNGAGAAAAGPACGLGHGESGPCGDGGKAELGCGGSGSWAARAKS